MIRPRVFPLQAVLLALLLVGGGLWAYLPVFREMLDKWFTNPQYSHAYLVPAFSAYLLWRGREAAALAGTAPSWLGLAPLLFGVALRLLGAVFYVSWLEAVSLLPLLWGAALLLGGRPALRWSFVAVGFLAFMIPLPHQVENGLSGPLQQVATRISTYALQTMGFPAFSEGNVIHLNDSRIGVVEACNGLGMLLLFFALATGMTLLIRGSWLERVTILLSAAPIAVFSNVVRVTVTGMLYETAGQRLGDLVFHDLAGWLMMPLALLVMWLELKVLSWLVAEVPADDDIPMDFVLKQRAGLQHAR